LVPPSSPSALVVASSSSLLVAQRTPSVRQALVAELAGLGGPATSVDAHPMERLA
jgi:hypothetical protein